MQAEGRADIFTMALTTAEKFFHRALTLRQRWTDKKVVAPPVRRAREQPRRGRNTFATRTRDALEVFRGRGRITGTQTWRRLQQQWRGRLQRGHPHAMWYRARLCVRRVASRRFATGQRAKPVNAPTAPLRHARGAPLALEL